MTIAHASQLARVLRRAALAFGLAAVIGGATALPAQAEENWRGGWHDHDGGRGDGWHRWDRDNWRAHEWREHE